MENDCPFKDTCPAPRDRMIVYRGPIDAEVVIIGQSPGVQEHKVGEPFVGPAGRKLCELLARAGWNDDDILYTNAVMCLPTDNETPSVAQIRLCRPNMLRVVQQADRKLVICLGNEAWASVHGSKPGGVTKGAGTVKPWPEGGLNCQSLWTIHPAAVLRDPSLENQLLHDLQLAWEIYSGCRPKLDEINFSVVCPKTGCSFPPLGEIAASPYLVYDVETTGVDWLRDELLGVGLGWQRADGEACYVYVALSHGEGPTSLWDEKNCEAKRWLMALFHDHLPNMLIAHNAKFDAKVLYAAIGITPPPAIDPMVLDAHVDENRPHGLKEAAAYYLNAPSWQDGWADESGRTLANYRDNKNLHLGMVPVNELAKYCCYDCHYARRLYEHHRSELTPKQWQLYTKVQLPQTIALLDMELRGVRVDSDNLKKASGLLEARITKIEEEVDKISGFAGVTLPNRKDNQLGVNLRSTKDLQFLLYDYYQLGQYMADARWRTKTGITVNEAALKYLSEASRMPKAPKKIIQLILEHRSLSKLQSTYIDGLLERAKVDGRIHSTFTQHVTETGRLSSREPNLQNIPDSVRPFFIADDGQIFIDADFSNIEVLVWAHYSQDARLIELLTPDPNLPEEENDFHRQVAALVFGKDAADITDDERGRSKVVIFGGIMYQGGPKVIAEQAGISFDEATALHKTLCNLFPDGIRWLHGQVAFARQYGYVESELGRIRRLPAIHSEDVDLRSGAERQATNTVIQSTAADITNIAFNRLAKFVHDELGYGALMNTVHDSILVQVPTEHAEVAAPLIEAEMTKQPYKGFSMPLRVKITVSERWGGEIDWDELMGV